MLSWFLIVLYYLGKIMDKTINQYLDSILDDIKFFHNPYFKNLKNGDFEKVDFIETQIQIYNVVSVFPKLLSDLIAKIPEGNLRMNIVQNLYEGHSVDASEDDQNLLALFLNRLGMPKSEIDKRALWPEARMFMMTARGTTALDSYVVAAGFLGAVECMFLSVAKWIEFGLVERGWLTDKDLLYYANHEKMDKKHAQNFFDLIDKPWNDSEVDKYYIKQGLLLGAFAFNDLYEHLYKDRKNRSFRTILEPHIKFDK